MLELYILSSFSYFFLLPSNPAFTLNSWPPCPLGFGFQPSPQSSHTIRVPSTLELEVVSTSTARSCVSCRGTSKWIPSNCFPPALTDPPHRRGFLRLTRLQREDGNERKHGYLCCICGKESHRSLWQKIHVHPNWWSFCDISQSSFILN